MIPAFLEELKYIRNVSAKTLELYHWSFKAFDGALENRTTIVKRIAELRDKGTKPVSVNTYLRCINAYFMWLHKERGKELLKIPKLKEEQHVLETLSPASLSAILNWKPKGMSKGRLHMLVCFLLDTGLRIDEALSLRTEHVDFDNLTLKVHGKGNKHRLVPFSLECRKLLWRYTKQAASSSLVFSTVTGTQLTQRNLLRHFHQFGKVVGAPGFHPHMCRHSFATNRIRKGGDLYMLCRVLGHSDIKTTVKYLRGLGISDIQETAQRVSLLAVGALPRQASAAR